MIDLNILQYKLKDFFILLQDHDKVKKNLKAVKSMILSENFRLFFVFYRKGFSGTRSSHEHSSGQAGKTGMYIMSLLNNAHLD